MDHIDWELLDWQRLARHLSGRSTAEERCRLAEWVSEDPAHRRFIEGLQRVWDAAEQEPAWAEEEAMVQEDWERLLRKMQAGEPERRERPEASAPDRHAVPGAAKRARPFSGQPIRVALVLMLLAGTAFLVDRVTDRSGVPVATEDALREISTEPGQRARIELGDGTRVRLSVDSKITLPRQFAANQREVFLEGEGYFDVAPDADRPFIIHAKEAMIQVLGTAFNVRAYGAEDVVEVAVAEGRVAVKAEQEVEGITLAARQMGRLRGDKALDVQRDVDLERYLAWTEGRLVFEDTPLRNVADALERWYALDVRIAGSVPAELRLTATLQEESATSALNIVAAALNLSYDRDHNGVTFSAQP